MRFPSNLLLVVLDALQRFSLGVFLFYKKHYNTVYFQIFTSRPAKTGRLFVLV